MHKSEIQVYGGMRGLGFGGQEIGDIKGAI